MRSTKERVGKASALTSVRPHNNTRSKSRNNEHNADRATYNIERQQDTMSNNDGRLFSRCEHVAHDMMKSVCDRKGPKSKIVPRPASQSLGNVLISSAARQSSDFKVLGGYLRERKVSNEDHDEDGRRKMMKKVDGGRKEDIPKLTHPSPPTEILVLRL